MTSARGIWAATKFVLIDFLPQLIRVRIQRGYDAFLSTGTPFQARASSLTFYSPSDLSSVTFPAPAAPAAWTRSRSSSPAMRTCLDREEEETRMMQLSSKKRLEDDEFSLAPIQSSNYYISCSMSLQKSSPHIILIFACHSHA